MPRAAVIYCMTQTCFQLFIKEFPDAVILDARQLIDPNDNHKTYDNVAIEYNLLPDNQSSVEYV